MESYIILYFIFLAALYVVMHFGCFQVVTLFVDSLVK